MRSKLNDQLIKNIFNEMTRQIFHWLFGLWNVQATYDPSIWIWTQSHRLTQYSNRSITRVQLLVVIVTNVGLINHIICTHTPVWEVFRIQEKSLKSYRHGIGSYVAHTTVVTDVIRCWRVWALHESRTWSITEAITHLIHNDVRVFTSNVITFDLQ